MLEGKARTWFTVQGYSFDEFGDALEWPELRETLLMTFRPADFERVARKKLQAVKQTGPDVSQYIAAFNKALNRCSNISPQEAQFLFEEHLWKEIALQVYNSNCTNLAESQTAAQRAGLVFMQAGVFSGRSQGFGKGKWRNRPLTNQNQTKNQLSSQYSSGSGSGFAPMVLG